MSREKPGLNETSTIERIIHRDEPDFIEFFDTFQSLSHQIAQAKGWWGPNGNEKKSFPEFIALCHSELSEALEWNRGDDDKSDHIKDFTGTEEELADVIIRIMDWAAGNNLDISGAVVAKLVYNLKREHRHGGKKF